MKAKIFTGLLTLALAIPMVSSASAQLGIVGNASVGATFINFGTFPTGTPYAAAGSYGTFEVNLVTAGGVFANNGVTTGETGMIQSLMQPTFPTTPFITFNTGGSNLRLFATSIPNPGSGGAGCVNTGTFLICQNASNVDVSVSIDGTITGDTTHPGAESFVGIFSATFPNTTVAALEAAAAGNNANNNPPCPTVNGVMACSPFSATFDVNVIPEPVTLFLMGIGLVGAGLVVRRNRARAQA